MKILFYWSNNCEFFHKINLSSLSQRLFSLTLIFLSHATSDSEWENQIFISISHLFFRVNNHTLLMFRAESMREFFSKWGSREWMHVVACAFKMFTFFYYEALGFSLLTFEIRKWKMLSLSRDAGKFHYKIPRAHVSQFSLASVSILFV